MSHPQKYFQRMDGPFLGYRMRYKMPYSVEGCKGLFLLSGFDVVRQSRDALSDLTPVRSVAGFKLSAPDRHLSWAMSGQQHPILQNPCNVAGREFTAVPAR
jgi:hypothetical protein